MKVVEKKCCELAEFGVITKKELRSNPAEDLKRFSLVCTSNRAVVTAFGKEPSRVLTCLFGEIPRCRDGWLPTRGSNRRRICLHCLGLEDKGSTLLDSGIMTFRHILMVAFRQLRWRSRKCEVPASYPFPSLPPLRAKSYLFYLQPYLPIPSTPSSPSRTCCAGGVSGSLRAEPHHAYPVLPVSPCAH